jgi:ADP-heptose:LPS heptosyltransferase
MGNWVLFESTVYLRGRGASFGGSLAPPQSVADRVYSIGISPVRMNRGESGVDHGIEIFKEASLDHVYIGPGVEVLQEKEFKELFKQASERLKLGGHLIVFSRMGHQEPGVLEIWPKVVEDLVGSVGKWQKKTHHEQDEGCLQIYKKIPGKRGILPIKPLPEGKRVCVVRYGAIGDGIIISPVLRQLKKDGYHVTLNINPYCKEVFKHNPNIDNLLIQERDGVPNHDLKEYWEYWEAKYDRYVQLSESLEGDLLVVENRPEFFTHQAYRHKRGNFNYYDYAMKRAGYGPETYGQLGEIFFTTAEDRRAQEWFKELGQDKFVVLWALNGSSHHKVYPLMENVILEWVKTHPETRFITTGDYSAKLLEFEHPQVICKAGDWMLREALLATKYVDLVIGPETGTTNAAGCWPTPKIVLMSHSTRENMTKYFLNDFSLEPDATVAPCWPCHSLHYSRQSCPEGTVMDMETNVEIGKAPICTLAISPQRLLARMEEVYKIWKDSK